MTEHKISLDDVIAKLQATSDKDTRVTEMLTAAIELRDTKRRDRKETL